MTQARTPHGRRKYDLARHHAWGGLGFLSLVMVLRILCPDIPGAVIVPILVILIVYVLVSLFLTYRYRSGLKEASAAPAPQGNVVPKAEKDGLKEEKKRFKAELKVRKKAQGA